MLTKVAGRIAALRLAQRPQQQPNLRRRFGTFHHIDPLFLEPSIPLWLRFIGLTQRNPVFSLFLRLSYFIRSILPFLEIFANICFSFRYSTPSEKPARPTGRSALPRDPRVSAKRGLHPIEAYKQRRRGGQSSFEPPAKIPRGSRIPDHSGAPTIAKIASEDELKSCIGCGASIQTDRPLELGFVPPHKYVEYLQWRTAVSQSLGLAPTKKPEAEVTDFTLGNFLDEESTTPSLPDTVSTTQKTTPPALSATLDNLRDTSSSQPIDVTKPMRITCQRCFELEHYGRVTPAAVEASHFLRAIEPIRDANALVVNVVDIFDFQGSFIPTFRKYSGANPVIVAANKVDLLPDGVQLARVKQWLHKEARAMGSGVVSVQLFSARTGEGIEDLASAIEWYRAGRPDVFVMGCANVGKSTLINRLIDNFRGPKQRKVTVSSVPGTTLSLIRLPIGENAWLFDTPGIFSETQIIKYLSEEELKKITPQKRLRPVVERISPGRTIFIGGLARMDYVSGPDAMFFTFFTSNELYLHKTQTTKADEVYESKRGSMLSPPSLLNKKLPRLVPHLFKFNNAEVRGHPRSPFFVVSDSVHLIIGRGRSCSC